jgi:hypothetical protein
MADDHDARRFSYVHILLGMNTRSFLITRT